MFKLIFWGIVIYLAYKVIFELILPVSQVATQLKSKMKDINEAQQKQYEQQKAQQQTQATKKPSHEEDYIDFEEVK